MFCAQPKGEEMAADERASPPPARSPPKVVEAVPPLKTAKVPLAVTAPIESVTRTPLVKEENRTVEEAKRVPKKGEVVPLKVWTVPEESVST